MLVALSVLSGCSSSSRSLSNASGDQTNVEPPMDQAATAPSQPSADNRDQGSSASNDFPVGRHGVKLGELRPSDWVADNGFRYLTTPYPIDLHYFLDHANLVTVVKRPLNERSSGLAAFRDSFVGRVLETDQANIAAGRPYKVRTYEFDCDARSMTLLSTSTGVFGQSDPNGKPQSLVIVPTEKETSVAMPSAQWNGLCQTNHGVPFRPAIQ